MCRIPSHLEGRPISVTRRGAGSGGRAGGAKTYTRGAAAQAAGSRRVDYASLGIRRRMHLAGPYRGCIGHTFKRWVGSRPLRPVMGCQDAEPETVSPPGVVRSKPLNTARGMPGNRSTCGFLRPSPRVLWDPGVPRAPRIYFRERTEKRKESDARRSKKIPSHRTGGALA